MNVAEHLILWFLLSTDFLTLQLHFVICCRPSRLKVSFPLHSRLPLPCCIVQAGFLQLALTPGSSLQDIMLLLPTFLDTFLHL